MQILETRRGRRLRLACKPLPDESLEAGRVAAWARGDRQSALAFHNEQMRRFVARNPWLTQPSDMVERVLAARK